MTWVFRVAYATVMGESLWLELGGVSATRELVPMEWKDANHWEVEVPVVEGEWLEYRYVLRREGEELLELREWGEMRSVACRIGGGDKVFFLDDWRSAGTDDRVYESKIFEVAEGGGRELGKVSWSGDHEFNLQMARVPEGLVPCVSGGIDALGDWDYSKALPMVEVAKNHWQVGLHLPADWRVEYKYGLYDPADGTAVRLEEGEDNRALDICKGADFVRVSDEGFRRSAEMRFRTAGVAIPVFSLRSELGCGVGEFEDLKPMAEWAVSAGLSLLQILPVNDTTSSRTWTDSYPYSAISVYALHPLYLRLDTMSYPLVDDEAFQTARELLNRAGQLDYEAVMEVKWRVTAEVFEKHREEILNDVEMLEFLKRNREWLLDYAVFSVKRDEFGTADSTQWGEWSRYDAEKVEALAHAEEVLYYVWLQYELDRQFSEAVSRLRSLGVALKGDLPIGVDRESVDAWAAPHLFQLDTQTGAPPDAFATKGQNWGFPTYDWEEMRKDGYAWWRSRFEKLSRYFDVYRIDHILGFFRIWQIPAGQIDGILGRFDPALPVRLEEFAQRGIPFEQERFCEPYIDDALLHERFGDFATGVRQDFFEQRKPGVYRFKNRFATQRDLLAFFSELGDGDWANQDWLRDALLGLFGEVLFFAVEDSEGIGFHPRMEMAETHSFRVLDAEVREKLQPLHDDYFYARQDSFWELKAWEKLPAMRAASRMLLCGEDLGMVPGCVPGVMRELGILELVIQRWPKNGGLDFYDLASAPYLSVVSTGTHDMPTLRGWWREDEVRRANFAWEMFGMSLPDRELSGEVARRILEQHLNAPAMLAVFPLQDLLAMDEGLRSKKVDAEQINIPAITPYYWRWRMELTIERLAAASEFNAGMSELVRASGR